MVGQIKNKVKKTYSNADKSFLFATNQMIDSIFLYASLNPWTMGDEMEPKI